MTVPGRTVRPMGVWAAAALSLLIPIAVWWRSVGDPAFYFAGDLPAGQAAYAFAKLAGLLAISVFFFQALLGMASRVKLLGALPTLSTPAHVLLGISTASLIALHVSFFVVATSLRKNAPAWDLLLPNVSHGYYFASISLGVFALYLLALAVFAGHKVRKGGGRWKVVHMAWAPAFALALTHALAIGSETRFAPTQFLYTAIGTTLAGLLAARVTTVFMGRRMPLPRHG